MLQTNDSHIAVKNRINVFFYKYFRLFVLVLLALLVYGGYFFVIIPKKSDLAEQQKKIALKEVTDKQVLESVLKSWQEYHRAYENIDTNAKLRLDGLLPPAGQADNLFSDIEALVLRQGLILNSLEISEAAPVKKEAVADAAKKSPYETIALSLAVSGVNTYERFKDFLSVLERNLRLTDITKFSFSEADGILELEIAVYAYSGNQTP